MTDRSVAEKSRTSPPRKEIAENRRNGQKRARNDVAGDIEDVVIDITGDAVEDPLSKPQGFSVLKPRTCYEWLKNHSDTSIFLNSNSRKIGEKILHRNGSFYISLRYTENTKRENVYPFEFYVTLDATGKNPLSGDVLGVEHAGRASPILFNARVSYKPSSDSFCLMIKPSGESYLAVRFVDEETDVDGNIVKKAKKKPTTYIVDKEEEMILLSEDSSNAVQLSESNDCVVISPQPKPVQNPPKEKEEAEEEIVDPREAIQYNYLTFLSKFNEEEQKFLTRKDVRIGICGIAIENAITSKLIQERACKIFMDKNKDILKKTLEEELRKEIEKERQATKESIKAEANKAMMDYYKITRQNVEQILKKKSPSEAETQFKLFFCRSLVDGLKYDSLEKMKTYDRAISDIQRLKNIKKAKDELERTLENKPSEEEFLRDIGRTMRNLLDKCKEPESNTNANNNVPGEK